ncbi:HAUS3 protein, partial [Upupa epops]|nr:HAUS3 protein [Upupa epops]
NRGAEFVAKLRQIYPHTSSLCEEDFDWLFDCPQTKQFIELFCSTVSEENVLSPAEVEAYEALLAAGKPILEGDALKQALEICCPLLQRSSVIPYAEGPSLEALQQELQELKGYRDCQLWRYNKLWAQVANLQQQLRSLEDKEKEAKLDVRRAQLDLKVQIFQASDVLSQITKDAKCLEEWYGNMGKGCEPVLLCEMDLGPYLQLEQLATSAFETSIWQHLPGSVQAAHAQGTKRDGSKKAAERMEVKQTTQKRLRTDGDELLKDQGNFWKEMVRTEKARICAQRELTVTAAKMEGSCAALQWVERTLEALKENQQAAEEQLQNQAGKLQKELHTMCWDIKHTLTHQLPPVLRAEAHLSVLPILQRHLSLEAAGLEDIAGKQREATAWLASQLSRLCLLEFQLKWEREELQQKAAQMEEMETAIKETQSMLQKDYFKDATSALKDSPCTWIDPSDLSAMRLWDMLMRQNREVQQFHSYKAIAAQCSQLVQDQRVLEAQLTAPIPQLPALESAVEVLYQLLYNSSNQLQLSSPEVTKLMRQSITMQESLQEKLTDFLKDLKIKRQSLEHPILQTERNLYLYFYCNEDRLREVVEELEKK